MAVSVQELRHGMPGIEGRMSDADFNLLYLIYEGVVPPEEQMTGISTAENIVKSSTEPYFLFYIDKTKKGGLVRPFDHFMDFVHLLQTVSAPKGEPAQKGDTIAVTHNANIVSLTNVGLSAYGVHLLRLDDEKAIPPFLDQRRKSLSRPKPESRDNPTP